MLTDAIGRVAATSGLAGALRRRRRQRVDFRVFVLEYHDVSSGDAREGIVTGARFRQHLAYLRRNYRVVSLETAMRSLADPGSLEEDLVVITFDDGYAGVFETALPALCEEGLPAVFFLTTGFLDGEELWFDTALRCAEGLVLSGRPLPADVGKIIGLVSRPGLRPETVVERLKRCAPDDRCRAVRSLQTLNQTVRAPAEPLHWEQVRRLIDEGHEIGCHTVSHPILSLLDFSAQEREICESRRRIEVETGLQTRMFAFPNGSSLDYDANTLTALQRLGFEVACTTIRGSNRPGCDPLQLRRIGVGQDSLAVLESRLSEVFAVLQRGFKSQGHVKT